MRKISQTEIISKFFAKFGNKFDYSKVETKGMTFPVWIICPIHGKFSQTPAHHLKSKHGCNLCSPTGGTQLTQQQFIDKCIKKHGNKYGYLKVLFLGVKHRIIITCYIHGDFLQIAEKHFEHGCADCANNRKITLEEFVERSNIIHNNIYDYSLVVMPGRIKNSNKKVKIICLKHGTWEQTIHNHLTGRGCKYCSKKGSYSKKEQLWLNQLGVPNDPKHRNVKLIIGQKKYFVDGCIPGTNVIYEFLGDFWHGNPVKYKPDHINKFSKKTFKELFNSTVSRIRILRSAGYKVITIWESKYDKNISNSRKSIKSK